MHEYETGGSMYRHSVDEELDRADWKRRDSEERALKLRKLKEQIRTGTYQADIKDIAMQLAAAMEPMA